MMHLRNNREAFSMITAIFVILLLASVGAFIMNVSGKVVQETTAQYRKEQAILYAKSYTEYAIMAAASQTCVRKITANLDATQTQVKQGQGYFVDVRIQYLGSNSVCTNNRINQGAITNVNAQNNIILIDTYVRYRDPDSIAAKNGLAWNTDSGMTYYRRTLQRL